MRNILIIFQDVASFLAFALMLYPIYASLTARRRNAEFSKEMKIFEKYVYATFIFQVLIFLLRADNTIILRIYMPFHFLLFSYLLLKWLNEKNYFIQAVLLTILLIAIDLVWGDFSYIPDLMIWFDSIVLLILSVFLSYKKNSDEILLSMERRYIHYGIYLYSLITIIGMTPSYLDLRFYGLFLQAIGVIISNVFFAWSFRCLYKQPG